MPAVTQDFHLLTSVLPTGSADDAPDAAQLRFAAHLALVRPLVDTHEGVVLREGVDRVLARFSDPVRAALCAVRIQQAHRNRAQGPAPPRIRVIVFGDEFTGTADGALAWSRPWVLATGASELVVSESVADAWREDGNRELTSRGVVTADGALRAFLLLWENHTHEPARTVRRRGWLFVGLIALPSLVLLAYSWLNLPPGNPQLTRSTLLWGPFWSASEPLHCAGAQLPRWQVIPDPRFTLSGLPRDPRDRLVRATGHVETRDAVRTAVMDLVDALSGQHLRRLQGPCEADFCACFAKLAEARLDEPATAPDPVVQEVCAALFFPSIPDLKQREAAIARCVTASSQRIPADHGGTP